MIGPVYIGDDGKVGTVRSSVYRMTAPGTSVASVSVNGSTNVPPVRENVSVPDNVGTATGLALRGVGMAK